MCLRTLFFLLLRGRVPNRLEILVSSQEGDRELLLPARLELLVRPSDRWVGLPREKAPGLSWRGKSLEKKQLSSDVLAALKGLGELRSSNTLARSLSSVAVLLQLLSLEKRRPKRPLGGLRGEEQSIEGRGLPPFS